MAESTGLVFNPHFTPEELAQWLGQTLKDVDFQPLKGLSVELAIMGSICLLRCNQRQVQGFKRGGLATDNICLCLYLPTQTKRIIWRSYRGDS